MSNPGPSIATNEPVTTGNTAALASPTIEYTAEVPSITMNELTATAAKLTTPMEGSTYEVPNTTTNQPMANDSTAAKLTTHTVETTFGVRS